MVEEASEIIKEHNCPEATALQIFNTQIANNPFYIHYSEPKRLKGLRRGEKGGHVQIFILSIRTLTVWRHLSGYFSHAFCLLMLLPLSRLTVFNNIFKGSSRTRFSKAAAIYPLSILSGWLNQESNSPSHIVLFLAIVLWQQKISFDTYFIKAEQSVQVTVEPFSQI